VVKSYVERMKAKSKPPSRKPLSKILWSGVGAFLGIYFVAIFGYYFAIEETFFLLGSFGASAVLIYGAPQADFHCQIRFGLSKKLAFFAWPADGKHRRLMLDCPIAEKNKLWIRACGMDAACCPSLRCILKQCLKLAQDAVYGQRKTFASFGSFQSRALPAQRHLNF
jgi:hypothetical protein